MRCHLRLCPARSGRIRTLGLPGSRRLPPLGCLGRCRCGPAGQLCILSFARWSAPRRRRSSRSCDNGFLVLLEVAALLEVGKEVADKQDQVGHEGNQPESRPNFGHLFGVEVEQLDLGEDVEVIKEPIEQEEGSDEYVQP